MSRFATFCTRYDAFKTNGVESATLFKKTSTSDETSNNCRELLKLNFAKFYKTMLQTI